MDAEVDPAQTDEKDPDRECRGCPSMTATPRFQRQEAVADHGAKRMATRKTVGMFDGERRDDNRASASEDGLQPCIKRH